MTLYHYSPMEARGVMKIHVQYEAVGFYSAATDDYDEGDPIGAGRSELEALRSLLEQLEEREEERRSHIEWEAEASKRMNEDRKRADEDAV